MLNSDLNLGPTGAEIKNSGFGPTNRASSEELRQGITEGLLSTGCTVYDLGLVVTPMVYFARVHYGIQGAVMVTGSHNPPEENGFKLAADGAGTIYGAEIQRVRQICERGLFANGHGEVKSVDVVPAYLDMLVEKIKLGPRRLKVVVDCAAGRRGTLRRKFYADGAAGWKSFTAVPIQSFPTTTPTR